jgi:hypothetical protein
LFQQEPLQDFTSFSQLVQSSGFSTSPFQQCHEHSHVSSSQLLQSSHFSIILFQHTGFSHSPIHISHKSSGHVLQSSFSSILWLGHDFISLHDVEQIFVPFSAIHKSHSSFHSLIQFQHFGVRDPMMVHLSEHLCLLFIVQLSGQSSHFSSHSGLPFQHIAVVFLHSKEHFQSYQLSVQLSHSSPISSIQFQQITEHFSHRSTGQDLQVSSGSGFQLPQSGVSGL